jgi:hypothetical protein
MPRKPDKEEKKTGKCYAMDADVLKMLADAMDTPKAKALNLRNSSRILNKIARYVLGRPEVFSAALDTKE